MSSLFAALVLLPKTTPQGGPGGASWWRHGAAFRIKTRLQCSMSVSASEACSIYIFTAVTLQQCVNFSMLSPLLFVKQLPSDYLT